MAVDYRSIVKNNYIHSPDTQALIDTQWEAIWAQACANAGEAMGDPSLFTEVQKVDRLSNELQHIFVGIETQGIHPYGTEQPTPGEPLKNSFKYLFHTIPLTRDIASLSTLHLALNPSQEEQGEIIDEIRAIFRALFGMVQERPNDKVLELLIGHLINIYAFLSCSESGERLEIPRKIEGRWQLVEFEPERIPLNSDWLGEVIEAYGLTPTERLDADPLLVFKGTRGTLSRFTDFNPGLAVGEFLYWLGKDKLDAWLAQNVRDGRRAQIYGMSLGGALAYHLAAHHQERVEIHAYAPPGLFARNFEGANIRGEIFMDPNDFVSLLGTHPTGPKMVKVIRGTPLNPALSHMRLYGGDETLLLDVNPAAENQRTIRTVLTVLHQIASVPLSILLLLACLVQGIYNQVVKLVCPLSAPGLRPLEV